LVKVRSRLIDCGDSCVKLAGQYKTAMKYTIQLLGLIFLLSIIGITNADEIKPGSYGKIQEINLLNSWLLIDSRRLKVTSNTEIRNFETPSGTYLRAMKIGQPVLFTATREHELLRLWIYPSDIRKRAQLLDDDTLERMH